MIWVKKIGVYRLNSKKEVAGDWVVFIDESIEFGNEKLLVILGIRESMMNFSRPLNYEDMTCLELLVSKTWKGQEISEVLNRLTGKIGPVKYAVADMGNAIKKALQLVSIPHVHDINHKLSWFIKELLEKDAGFENYGKILANLRGTLPLSKMAYILPPQQRINSRYMNLQPIFNWGLGILDHIRRGSLDPEESKRLLPVKAHEKLIREGSQLVHLANRTQEIIKNNGLSHETKNRCIELFDGHDNERIVKFKEMLEQYLSQVLDLIKETKKVQCSSDILESSFGKYKNFISKNKSVGITDLALAIPAFLGKTDEGVIKRALESLKANDVNQWKTNNIGESLSQKRRNALKDGTKKKMKAA